jgi:riboflavin kinase/FMN adenylyltransferase
VKIIRGVTNVRFEHGCVLTIGNFDGVHRGHQALLQRLARLAEDRQLPSVLLTFEPHPIELIAPALAPFRLTRFREKMSVLHTQPIDYVVCMPFDPDVAAMSAQQFIDEVLCRDLNVQHLLVGDDFHFGHRGAGDFKTLQDAADAGMFAVSRLDTVVEHAKRVSSTRIRNLIAQGELDEAVSLLGRPVTVCGRVEYGQQLGRTIGFATANFALRRIRCALSGVYAVTLHDALGRELEGVANVGTRPTVNGTQSRVEVHVLDFDEDLYGQAFQIQFHHRIRPEQRFDGLDALKAQIALDVEAARAAHARRSQDDLPDG